MICIINFANQYDCIAKIARLCMVVTASVWCYQYSAKLDVHRKART